MSVASTMTQPRNGAASQPQGVARMSLQNITRGRQEQPMRVILYGVEGVGKSTFASQAPAPVFLCSENGTAHLDVARFPMLKSWSDVLEAVRVLTYEEHAFKTLVIDTIDHLEPLCWTHVCRLANKSSIEDFGYGKGYVLATEQWRLLFEKLDELVRDRKMHVVLLGHATIKRVNDPQVEGYDRYRLKIHEKSSDVMREWVDAILFARHEVSTYNDGRKVKGRSTGHRVVFTQWTYAYDAKNRWDLPPEMSLSWADLEAAAKAHAPANPEKLRAELLELIPKLDPGTRAQAEEHLEKKAGNDPARLAQLLDRVRSKVALAGNNEEPAPAAQAASSGEG